MENNIKDNSEGINHSGKVWAGLFIIGVGTMLLLRNVGLDFPDWVFRWHTLLIVLGLFIGLKHRFQHAGWLVMVLIGTYFTLDHALNLGINFNRVTLPLLLVIMGIFLILKPKSNYSRHRAWRRRGNRWQRKYGNWQFEQNPEAPQGTPFQAPGTAENAFNSNDYLDSVNVFGGSHQTVYSKNFRGGEIVAIFGGCDLNLSQADFENTIEIDITAIFGGCKIIVPPGWQVKSEVTAIFGGIDDKRSVQPLPEGQTKLLIIRGLAMFGGVDIRNF